MLSSVIGFPVPEPVSSEAIEDICSICHEQLGSGGVAVVRANCGHLYDAHCITRWLQRNTTLMSRTCCLCLAPALPLVLVRGDVDPTNPFLYHQVLGAALQGDMGVLESILARNPSVLSQRFHDPVSDQTLSLLMAAASQGHLECVRLLVECEAEQGISQGGSGSKALMLACQNGHLDVVRFMMKAGVGVKGFEGIALLLRAARHGDFELPRNEWDLLLNDAMESSLQKFGCEAMRRAAGKGQLEIVRFLLNNDVSYRTPDHFKCTAFMYAVHNGHLGVIRLLLDKGPMSMASILMVPLR